MNWKQFLKPDWRKIVIFIFFAFIFGILLMMLDAYFFTEPGSDCLGCKSPEILIKIGQFFLPLGIGFLSYLGDIPVSLRIFTFLIVVLSDFIFWYIFSCLIVLIYDKTRKRK